MAPSKGREQGEMKHLSDQELMRIVQGGDYSPASEIYDRYSGRIYNFAFRFLKNAEAAEDAVQECYLRALRHFDSYRGPAMKPWLLTILRNVCKSEFARRSAAAVSSEMNDEHAEDPPPIWQEPQPSPEAQLLQRRDGETIRRLVAALPPPFREAVVLRDINNLSYREIAEVAGIPVGTVMSRLARARSMLRAAWNGEEGPTP